MMKKETDLRLHLLFIFLTIRSISFQEFISQILSHFITFECFPFLSSTFPVPHSLISFSLSKTLFSRPFETVFPFSHHSVSLQLCYYSCCFLLPSRSFLFHLTGNLHQPIRNLILLVKFSLSLSLLSPSLIISLSQLLALSLSLIISPCLTQRVRRIPLYFSLVTSGNANPRGLVKSTWLLKLSYNLFPLVL